MAISGSIAASQVGLFLSMSTYLALCIDEPGFFRLFGIWRLHPSNAESSKFGMLKFGLDETGTSTAVTWATVTVACMLSQIALVSLILSSHTLQAGCTLAAILGVLIIATIFTCHDSRDLTYFVLVYLAAISLTAIWVDWSLMRFVAAADATAVVAVLAGILLKPISVASKGTAAVAASIETSDAAVLAEAKARAIAGASHYSLAKAASLCVALAFASVLECGAEDVRLLQPLWAAMVAAGEPYVRNYLLPVSVATATYVLVCCYFSYLDLTRCVATKIQRDWWPTMRDMWGAAWPQLLAYSLGQVKIWALWWMWPDDYSYTMLPQRAPTCLGLLASLTFCLVVGDFLIYWEHRMMHAVPFLRRHVHSVHHEYTAVFSWAGGWVHPLEDIVAVICQAIPVLLIRPHPLTQWLFAALWVVCLVDEHSGHDVWWSPYQLLPYTGCPQGGGAAPHDIHHYKPTRNYGFIFVTWDRLFGTFEAVSEAHPCNPFEPPFSKERRRRKEA